MFFDYQKAQRMKERYPSGTRIRLNSMEDPYAPIAPGTEGTVNFVDDIGTLHCTFDNGRTLGVVPGEDGQVTDAAFAHELMRVQDGIVGANRHDVARHQIHDPGRSRRRRTKPWPRP